MVTSISLSEVAELTESVEAARPRDFFLGWDFCLAAAFLAAAAAASLAAPEPLDFWGLRRGGLFFLDFAAVDAVEDFFLLLRTSESLSLLSLKILLYLSTVLRLALLADLDEAASDVVLLVVEAVVGVEEGLTDGDAWDPGEDEAAMAAFLACWALAASLATE